MSQSIQVNGQTINYPETGDTNWADDATNFAIQTSAALGKIGLSSGTSVDITQTLDVTGNTTLDANLSVGGNASVTGNTTLTGNLTANGNTQLGNSNTDTIGVTGIVNVDAGTLYVDPVNNRVGINKITPVQAFDVNGNALISGTLGVTGITSLSNTLGIIGDVSVNTNKFNITASSGNTSIAGTLRVTGDVAINTNKFNVTASSGNTTIAGTLGISNGTALDPAITPSGDTNTGLYSISADKIGFSANGARQGEFGVGYGGFTGNIIQVVQGSSGTRFSSTSTSFITFSDGVSITPKYTNSKFLIIYVFSSNASVNMANDFARKIGSGSIVQNISGKTQGISTLVNATTWNINTLIYLDSPSLTDLSPITYYLSSKVSSGTMTTMNTGSGVEFSPFIIAEVQQ